MTCRGHSVWYDEAVAANNSSGTLSEVIPNTRHRNSSPILYPLALWAVQKVDVSAFSIRILPATASVLTVAALLFLLPPRRSEPVGRVSGGSAGDSFGCRNRARPGCARILHRRAACRADDSGAAGVSAGWPEGPALPLPVPCAVAPVRSGSVRRCRNGRRYGSTPPPPRIQRRRNGIHP